MEWELKNALLEVSNDGRFMTNCFYKEFIFYYTLFTTYFCNTLYHLRKL